MSAQTTVDSQPTLASSLRRHRPGHQTRMQALGKFLADNNTADPLLGNYVLVQQQDIILNFQGLGDQVAMMAFNAANGSNGSSATTLTETGSMLQGDSVTGKHLAVTTGDLDGDGLDEIASLYRDGDQLQLVLAKNADPAQTPQSLSFLDAETIGTGLAHLGPGNVRIVAGDFTGESRTTLATLWPRTDGTLSVTIWSYDLVEHHQRILFPVVLANPITLASGGSFDVAVGHFDDTNATSLAIAWTGAADKSGNTLFLSICSLDAKKSSLVTTPAVGIGTLGASGECCIAAGPFLSGSESEQIAVGWANADGHAALRMCDANGTNAPQAQSAVYVDTANPLTDSMLVRIAAGDLDLDGSDEIVFASVGQKAGYQAAVILRVFKPDNTLTLALTSIGATGVANEAMAAVDLRLAIGEVGNGASSDSGDSGGSGDNGGNGAGGGFFGLIIAALGAAGPFEPLRGLARLYLGLVNVTPALLLPEPLVNTVSPPNVALLTFDNAQDPTLDLTLSMALGDFSGQSLRVGPPKAYRFENVTNILAIINAPPLQAGVNFDGGSQLTFSDIHSDQTSVGVTASADWVGSNTLSANLDIAGMAQLNGSLSTTYGNNFSKTDDMNKSLTLTVTDTLWQDDLISLAATAFSVWEYPVYNDATGTPKGHLLIAVPDLVGVQTIPNWGTNTALDYEPDHVNGNLLSYSQQAPADYVAGGAINNVASSATSVGTGLMNTVIDWQQQRTVSQQTTSHVSTSISEGASFSKTFNFLAGSGIGISAHLNDTYTKSTMNNYSMTYTESTSIAIQYGSVDVGMDYTVYPYIYFSSEGGFLVVDYAVESLQPSPGLSNYWSEMFSQPSATFNMAWANSAEKDLREYTRSIRFTPQADGTVLITARVANYSLAPTYGVLVAFYLGEPNASLIGAAKIATIQPQARENASVIWTPPKTPGDYRVYVTLAPSTGETPAPSSFAPSRGYRVWTVASN
jgi:hypothetical protein